MQTQCKRRPSAALVVLLFVYESLLAALNRKWQ